MNRLCLIALGTMTLLYLGCGASEPTGTPSNADAGSGSDTMAADTGQQDGDVAQDTPNTDAPADTSDAGQDTGQGQPNGASEDLEVASAWGRIALASGAAIGRCLEAGDDSRIRLADCDGDAATQFVLYAPGSGRLHVNDESCWIADDTGLLTGPCDNPGALRVALNDIGQLYVTTDAGTEGCLTIPGTEQGSAVTVEDCDTRQTGMDLWGIEPYRAPIQWESIVQGVQSIVLDSDYFPVAAIEGRAVPLLKADDGRAIAAVGTLGDARFANFGSWRGVQIDATSGPYIDLFRNLVSWLGGKDSPVVGLIPSLHDSGLQSWLDSIGVNNQPVSYGDDQDWSSVDLLILDSGQSLAYPQHVTQIEAFLQRGAGVMAGRHVFLPWETSTYRPVDGLTGRILTLGGISWTQDAYQSVDPGTTIQVSALLPSRLTQAQGALEALAREILDIEDLSAPDRATIATHLRFTGAAQTRLRASSRIALVSGALGRKLGPLIIGPEAPFTWEMLPARDTQLYADYLLASALPPEQTKVHPSSTAFPGTVSRDAQPGNATVVVDGDVPEGVGNRWRSTGYYAPPGVPVTITIPESLVDAGLSVRLGTAFDNPMREVGWLEPSSFERFPQITAARRIFQTETRLATAFGGPVILVIPERATLGSMQVQLRGVVPMPHFILGQTTAQQWTDALATAQVPLGELESPQVIFTVRTEVLQELPDPTVHLGLLAQMIRGESYFVGRVDQDEVDIHWPQRLVFDPFEQWGAHSGYPVHMTQSWDRSLLNRDIWPGGSGLWGFTHEMGHNHQRAAWTLDGWTEVTCNLIGAYAIEEVAGIPLEQAWEGNLEPERIHSTTQAWLDSGRSYDTQGYAVSLYFLLFLKDGFGWDLWREFFAEMETIPQNQWPQGDAAKIDNMVVRLSEGAQRNLAPFFERFQFPVSQEASASAARFPDWEQAPY